ncbi:MAG: hypothetical protein EOM70_11220 [Clostridia bacterium]|nr:hypothetical protein [Clostridia bacterium]
MTTAVQKNARVLLVITVYAMVLFWLLSGMTQAKFQETSTAYARFGAANFNAVILGDNTPEAMTDPETPVVNEFGAGLATSGLRPGMTWQVNPDLNTARTFPFTIANGRDQATASESTVEYSIILQTTGHLPLQYTLTLWQDNLLEEGGGHYEIYTPGEPIVVERENPSDSLWYEYTFHPAATVAPEPALFEIQGGQLALNAHQLVVEWSSTAAGSNLGRFMKEVELLQLKVEVSSKNRLVEDGYLDTQVPEIPVTKASGILVLEDKAGIGLTGQEKQRYAYTIDLASFRLNGDEARFDFELNNGIELGLAQTATALSCDLYLKVPLGQQSDDMAYGWTDLTEGLAYGWRDLVSQSSAVPLVSPEYRLYNEMDGSYANLTAPENWPTDKTEPGYRLYAFYKLTSDKVLVNKINNPSGEGTLPFADASSFQLSIRRTDGSDWTNEAIAAIRFANKLEIQVETTPVNN